MNARFFSLIVLFFVFLVCGGCSTTYLTNLFPPAYSLSVVNNTNVPLDIEWGEKVQHKGLLPGKTHLFELGSFRSDTQIVLFAKGYHGDKYIGVASRKLYFSNRKGIEEEWIINSLSAPVDVIGNRGL